MAGIEFAGKFAIVTGASGGIGGRTAEMLASRGASVALMDICDPSTAAADIRKRFGGNATSIQVDVTDHESVKEAFGKFLAWSSRLDICVNAAGIFPFGDETHRVLPREWAKVMAVNVGGTFFCMQQEIKIFLDHKVHGSIVNISSDAGSVATAKCGPYVASKHAVNGLTKTAALEYAKQGIRVNAVAPGNIDTQMIANMGSLSELARDTQPTGRCGKPEEVAELICFLLSERSPFMTGSIVAIDGGITATGYGL